MNDTTKYQHEIDCIRGLAILIVMLRHTKVFWYADSGIFPELWFHGWTFFAVPTFFFLSGFSLTMKYKNSLNIWSFYKKRFITLIPIYLLWTFLYTLISEFNQRPFYEILIQFILVAATGSVVTLWYVSVLFQMYFLYPFILKIFKKLNFVKRQLLIFVILIFMFVCYLFGDKVTDIIFLYLYFGPWLIYFLIGIDIAFYWNDIKVILRKNQSLKVILTILFLISFVTLPYFVTQTYPRKPAPWILNNIISIFFLLMVFNQRRIYTSPLNSEIKNKNNVINANHDFSSQQLNFEGRFFGYISRFFYINGQYSLVLFMSHRVFMEIVQLVFLHFFGIDIKFWQEELPRFEAFLFSIFIFLLVYIFCMLFAYLFWNVSKNKYIIGKKSSWLSIKERKIIKFTKKNKEF